MGIVHRARHRLTGRQAALKIIDPQPELGVPPDELRARFQREIDVLARVRSTRVVEVFEHGELSGDRLWLAMELAEGSALDTVLVVQGPLPARKVLAIGLELAKALGDVHAAGLVHRDVKPGNIVVADLEGKPRLKLVDFGIARALAGASGSTAERLTLTGMVLGSLGYMAPEQSSGASEPDPTIDVYACGVTLFELATGRLPFDGPTAAAFALQHRSRPVPSVVPLLRVDDGAGDALDGVLARALAKTPGERPPDGGALAREIGLALRVDPAVRTTVDRVRARVAEVQHHVEEEAGVRPRARVTKGRVAAAIAAALGLATLVWGLVGHR
ncbi:MAG: serine/threonine protein kinase [Deltaproteobacteria bacterium]|nr:serine/threonine protein kinase [Deltaproteobacteria bacterium]